MVWLLSHTHETAHCSLQGSKDKTVRLWAVSTGENIATLQGHEKMVFSVAFSLDGTKLASGSEDTSIRLWEIPTGKALYTLGGVNSPQIRVEVLPARPSGGGQQRTSDRRCWLILKLRLSGIGFNLLRFRRMEQNSPQHHTI